MSADQLSGPREMWLSYWIDNFQTHMKDIFYCEIALRRMPDDLTDN